MDGRTSRAAAQAVGRGPFHFADWRRAWRVAQRDRRQGPPHGFAEAAIPDSKTAKETKKPAKPKPAAEPENLPLRLELRKLKWSRSKCCWPSGDPKLSGFTFCGDAVVPGKPYCLKHCEEAYTTSRDSR